MHWGPSIGSPAVLLVVLAWACQGSDTGGRKRETPGWPLGGPCDSNKDCESGQCQINVRNNVGLPAFCSKPCSVDADCSVSLSMSLVCGIDPGGTRACVPRCDEGRGFACKDGTSVACQQLDETYCEECGCEASLRCEAAVGCMPKRGVGEPCSANSDCHSENCSLFAQVCRVPIGSACSINDCDRCIGIGSGGFCSRECTGDAECNGSACLGDPEVRFFTCRPGCRSVDDLSCPGTCRYSDNGRLYCNCSRCTISEPTRAPGVNCSSDTQCEGRCVNGVCRGTGTVGSPCAAFWDCAVGQCCPSGVCGSSC
jgi:hypothetical protein